MKYAFNRIPAAETGRNFGKVVRILIDSGVFEDEQQVADKMDISLFQLVQIMDGRKPVAGRFVVYFARHFGASPFFIYCGAGDPIIQKYAAYRAIKI